METLTKRPTRRVGIDVGHVIMDGANDGTETDFVRGDRYLEATAVPGCIETVRDIVAKYGSDNVFIVSKCGTKTQQRTRHWLAHNRFYEATGMLAGNVHFCLMIQQKGPICIHLGIDAFIDDRLGVHYWIHQSDPGIRQILFGNQSRDRRDFAAHLAETELAADWKAVRALLL